MNRISINKQINKNIIFLLFTLLSLAATAQDEGKRITIQNKNSSLKIGRAHV